MVWVSESDGLFGKQWERMKIREANNKMYVVMKNELTVGSIQETGCSFPFKMQSVWKVYFYGGVYDSRRET